MKVYLYKDLRDDSLFVLTYQTLNEFRLMSIQDYLTYSYFIATATLWLLGYITISWS